MSKEVYEDETTVAKIVTPGGHVVEVEFDKLPSLVRDAIEEHDPVLAAEIYAKLLGCKVTIEQTRMVTVEPV